MDEKVIKVVNEARWIDQAKSMLEHRGSIHGMHDKDHCTTYIQHHHNDEYRYI